MFLGWACVVAVLLGRFAFVHFATRRRAARARPVAPGELAVDLGDLVRRAGLERRREVRFLITDELETPAAGGILRPYVLLPAGLLPRLAPGPLRWVLLHELAHVRRRDVAVALLQRLVQIAFFFHPAVWIANRVIDEQREFACDADALERAGATPRVCGAGFLSVVEWARGREVRGATATLGVFDSQSVIRRRMMRILDSRRSGRLGTAVSAALTLVVAAFVLPSSDLRADAAPVASLQDPEQRKALRELQREIEELRRRQARLQRRLEELRRGHGGETETETESAREPRARYEGQGEGRTDRRVRDYSDRIRYLDGDRFELENKDGAYRFELDDGRGGYVLRTEGGDGAYVLRSGEFDDVYVLRPLKGEKPRLYRYETEPGGVYYLRQENGEAQLRRADGDSRSVRRVRVGEGETVELEGDGYVFRTQGSDGAWVYVLDRDGQMIKVAPEPKQKKEQQSRPRTKKPARERRVY